MNGAPFPHDRHAVPALPLGLATPLSELGPRARRAAPWSGPVARASLGLALATMSTGCLLTDPPQFKPAKHTRPFLLEATADPDPRAVLVVDSALIPSTQNTLPFSANVMSQDDPADSTSPTSFQQVEAWLYVDYGLDDADPLSPPHRFAFPATRLDPGGTLDDIDRRVKAVWRPGLQKVDPGCHTVTLVVAHKFDDLQCPLCVDDFSAITWQILRCDRTKLGDCDALPVSGPGSCESLTNSCATVRAKLEAEDAGVVACPEGEGADGGTE